MVQLAQCVYLLKQVILKKRDADFWITAQELLSSCIFEHSCWLFCQNAFSCSTFGVFFTRWGSPSDDWGVRRCALRKGR